MSTFTLGRLLGASKLSEVFQAHKDGRNYALKRVLHLEHRDILKREFDCLKALHHPNIVKVHDWIESFSQTNHPAFTMTQLQGVNGKVLAERLQRLPSAERHRRIISIGLQLCSALKHIHDEGWIHRDIKPSNLMFEREQTLLLIDFGTVTKHPMHHSEGMIGTPRYASPEQLCGHLTTLGSDQFSMGATLYFMLLNKRPFDSRERSIPMRPSLIDPSIPTHLESIILKCLAVNPEERFESIEEIMMELNRVSPSEQPLAGREQVIHQIAQCLQRVHQGEQLHVHFVGTRGSGKTWANETLCEAALQQGLNAYVLDSDKSSKDLILERIGNRFPLIVCTRDTDIPKLGLPIVVIHIEWLGLSQLRRSLFSYAPKTPNLTEKSQWLHQQTEGIPALLLPMLMEYTIRDAFHFPQVPENLLPEDWVQDLSEIHWKILRALTYLNTDLSIEELSTIVPSCTDSILTELKYRSLIKQRSHAWGISCALVASYIKRYRPINPITLHHWQQDLSRTVKRSLLFREVDLLSAQGDLSAAKSYGEQLVAKMTSDKRLQCMIALGQVYLDMGDHVRASSILADATTLSNLRHTPTIYLHAQALRGRASLEQHQSSPIGAMHALDRLSKLLPHNNPWVQSVWQWALGALGDKRQWSSQIETSINCIHPLSEHHKIRCTFNLIRGACCIGDIDCTKALIANIEPMVCAYPLLKWEIQRVKSIVYNIPPPVIGSLAYDLTAQEILLFKKRWVRVKGKHPDPTWYQ